MNPGFDEDSVFYELSPFLFYSAIIIHDVTPLPTLTEKSRLTGASGQKRTEPKLKYQSIPHDKIQKGHKEH